jgi:hypothetical protein
LPEPQNPHQHCRYFERGIQVAKSTISNTDLIWIFRQELKSFKDGSSTIPIAIVPSNQGWTALTPARYRAQYPGGIKRIEQVQEQLRKTYVLGKD